MVAASANAAHPPQGNTGPNNGLPAPRLAVLHHGRRHRHGRGLAWPLPRPGERVGRPQGGLGAATEGTRDRCRARPAGSSSKTGWGVYSRPGPAPTARRPPDGRAGREGGAGREGWPLPQPRRRPRGGVEGFAAPRTSRGWGVGGPRREGRRRAAARPPKRAGRRDGTGQGRAAPTPRPAVPLTRRDDQ